MLFILYQGLTYAWLWVVMQEYLQQQKTSSYRCCSNFTNLLEEIPYTPKINEDRGVT